MPFIGFRCLFFCPEPATLTTHLPRAITDIKTTDDRSDDEGDDEEPEELDGDKDKEV